MSIDHYENFPVASVLLPAHLRSAVEAIYAFARSADDLADEGNEAAEVRLAALKEYDYALDRIECRKTVQTPLFQHLANAIDEHRLPVQPLRDLLSAFTQDVTTTRYRTFSSLLEYCRRSANPVGVLMLHLYKSATPSNLSDSDAICSALQLTNFWQDVAIDWRKNRIYLPEEDLERFGVTVTHIADAKVDDAWRALMRYEIARTRALMLSGAPLALRLHGRIGWELRLVVQGGLRILDRIEAADYDVFRHRPRLQAYDWLVMLGRAVRMKSESTRPA